MFKIEWTAHEPKPRAEIDDLYGELQASVDIDGPYEFAALVCAARLLETRYVMARIIGYPDREPTLDYADIVEFFECSDAVLEALAAHRAGVIEFYPGSDAAEYLVFDASDPVRLFRVPWPEALRLELEDPLPRSVTERPVATCGRRELADHIGDLRREFARDAVRHDPRLAAHEPVRRWSLDEGGPAVL